MSKPKAVDMIRTTSMALAIAAITATSAFAGGKLGEVSDAQITPPAETMMTGSVTPVIGVVLLAGVVAIGLADDSSGGGSSSSSGSN